MKVDIEDVLFWMDAIRNSDDRYRTLESFWKGQVYSKIWLIENLKKLIEDKPNRIVIYGGWNGVLAALLFNSDIPINHITSVDKDPNCEEIARTVNKRYEMQGKFHAITEDMCKCSIDADIIINTVCEHINQDEYDRWLDKQSLGSLIVLQSNNYEIDEHVRIAKSQKNFSSQSYLDLIYEDFLEFSLYTRWMIFGVKTSI